VIDPEQVAARLADVRARIASVDVDPASVQVVAVTKGFGADAVRAATMAGLEVGENYAQEAAAKHEELVAAPDPVQPTWHFIGQLQRNKVRLVAPFVDLWQTVGSLGLAAEIAKRAPGARVLVQVNLSDDPARGGCAWGELEGLVAGAVADGLDVHGLMGVAPLGGPGVALRAFERLAAAAEGLGLPVRSMGMSGDYLDAVRAGSTMVRLGSTFFGPRPHRGAESG